MRVLLGAAVALFATAAHAGVIGASESGFSIENRVRLAAPPDAAWQALGEVGRWWSSEHSYSGSASNMFIEMKPGGCWCEALPGGGVEHGRVVLIWPEQRMLRLDAALGPLQEAGVSAALIWKVNATDTGGSEVVQTYNVGGASPEMVKAAGVIDGVLAQQLKGLGAYLEPAVP